MGAHPISCSLALALGLVVFTGCASEDLTTLNPSIAVCRGAASEACGTSFELSSLAVGRTHQQDLYIRNVGSGYLDVRSVSLLDVAGEVLTYPQSLVTGQSGLMTLNVEVTAGMHRFRVLIESNDPVNRELVLDFTYNGVQSDLVACPVVDGALQQDLCQPELTVPLSGVRRAEAREITVAVANRGTASFYLENAIVDVSESLPAEWEILTSTSAGEMPADRVYMLTFRYEPKDEIADTLTVQLYEEDHEEPSVVITLAADSFANEPPVALATIWETELAVAEVLMGEEIWLDGSASYDPEGDELTYSWNLLNAPPGSVAAFTHSDSGLTAMTLDERGNYEIELRVEDSLGQASTAMVEIAARSQFALEVQATWPIGMGDVDLHMVPLGEELFSNLDCHFQNGTADWGEQGNTIDDPYLMYDTQGINAADESVVLESPADGIYAIYVHYFESQSTSAIPIGVSVWGDDGETLLGESTAALAQPCDTVWVGNISWPSGLFEAGDPASFSLCFPGGDQ